jgi:hypothetical protein
MRPEASAAPGADAPEDAQDDAPADEIPDASPSLSASTTPLCNRLELVGRLHLPLLGMDLYWNQYNRQRTPLARSEPEVRL